MEIQEPEAARLAVDTVAPMQPADGPVQAVVVIDADRYWRVTLNVLPIPLLVDKRTGHVFPDGIFGYGEGPDDGGVREPRRPDPAPPSAAAQVER